MTLAGKSLRCLLRDRRHRNPARTTRLNVEMTARRQLSERDGNEQICSVIRVLAYPDWKDVRGVIPAYLTTGRT